MKTIADTLQRAENVYSSLNDPESKEFFKHTLLFKITRDYSDFENTLSYTSPQVKKSIQELEKPIQNAAKNPQTIIIYGAGLIGITTFRKINRKENILFCDQNYATQKEVQGIPVISPQELIQNYPNSKIIIANYAGEKEICHFLLKNNIPKENILPIGINDIENQYFDDIMKIEKDEIFVDAGAYDGYTTIQFAKWCNNTHKAIYLFEPDQQNLKMTNNNIEENNIKRTTLFPYGLWNKEETLKFHCQQTGSCIDNTGEIEIKTNTLDNLLKNIPVTFIKMDIEGAELNALKGAKETISKYRPKLAISVYHKPEDIITIPEYIKSLVPEYKFYLRHYTNSKYETVLYGVIE